MSQQDLIRCPTDQLQILLFISNNRIGVCKIIDSKLLGGMEGVALYWEDTLKSFGVNQSDYSLRNLKRWMELEAILQDRDFLFSQT